MFALRIAVSQVLACQYLEASLDWLAKLLASLAYLVVSCSVFSSFVGIVGSCQCCQRESDSSQGDSSHLEAFDFPSCLHSRMAS